MVTLLCEGRDIDSIRHCFMFMRGHMLHRNVVYSLLVEGFGRIIKLRISTIYRQTAVNRKSMCISSANKELQGMNRGWIGTDKALELQGTLKSKPKLQLGFWYCLGKGQDLVY